MIIRLSAVLGPQWLQAYVLLDVHPGVDIDALRLDLPRRLKYHHETEKYVGGVPGDLFVGFFVRGQGELFEQMSQIKAMEEVQAVKEWAIANFPVAEPQMTALDWRILGTLRKDALLTAAAIADGLEAPVSIVEERLGYLKGLPLAFSIEPPNDKAWSFTEIQLDFHNTTFMERAAELQKIGKPFAAASNNKSGALMVEPESIEQLVSMIQAASKIEGVRVVDYAFCEDMLWTQPWLDSFIEQRIAEWREM